MSSVPASGMVYAAPHVVINRNNGLPSDPAQSVRRMQSQAMPQTGQIQNGAIVDCNPNNTTNNGATMKPPRLPPIPQQYQGHIAGAASPSGLSVSGPISPTQVINLAREAMKSALRENQSQASEASGVSNELKPGVTIDLSRKNIQELPDEVVDIIKNELERLALSHNRLSTFPATFSECTSLRYLNVRNNHIKEFPLPFCDLKSLEILDLGRNKISVLPPDIAKLASLKVLAVQKNRIAKLPLCLADMVSLQVLKLDGNQITFPPKEVLKVQAASPPNEGFLKEREVTEVAMTAHIKKFLRQKSLELAGKTSLDTDNLNINDEGSEGVETPRGPLKRVVSGRFPIKVNNGETNSLRSPNVTRAPPIPSRSHARGLSQQNTIVRRLGVMPLTIGNPNERIRSNSETLLQRAERPSDRPRRMGLMSRKAQELGTLDEAPASNRLSHYRGLSYGSSMTGNLQGNVSAAAVSPNSPGGPLLQRPNYVRRLSILPEQRRESKYFDPIVEYAKGILYSIFQIHPMIQLFTRLSNDGTPKRSSLEIVFYNTNVHVEELEQEILKHEPLSENDGYAPRENENVQRAVLTLVNAYSHVCSILINNMDMIVNNADPRYIRTLMMLLYHSIMELRVIANEVAMSFPTDGTALPDNSSGGDTPMQTQNGIKLPTIRKPALDNGIRYVRDTNNNYNNNNNNNNMANAPSDQAVPQSRARMAHPPQAPGIIRIATDVAVPYINGTGRTATVTPATPRSGDVFTPSNPDARYPRDFTAEERLFEKVFLSLRQSSDLVMRTLPQCNSQFNSGFSTAKAQRAPEHVVNCWRELTNRCVHAIQQTDQLRRGLSTIKLREPNIKTDPVFWSLCKGFVDAWAEHGTVLRQAMALVPIGMGIKTRLRPVQISIKETMQLIMDSPWGYLFHQSLQLSQDTRSAASNHQASNSSPSHMISVTPQSAALGPAVQATVPLTPQSASFAHAFTGNVFERADALISTGGMSISSRSTTMNSTSTNTSLSSISSIGTLQDERWSGHSRGGPHPHRRHGGKSAA